MTRRTIAIISGLSIIVAGGTSLSQKGVSSVTVKNLPVDSLTVQKFHYNNNFNDAPDRREYVFRSTAFFKDSLIINLDFNNGGSSFLRSGKFSRTLGEVFYTRKMSEGISKEYAASRYTRDSLDFISDMDKLNLENIYTVAQGDKSYLLFFFHKDIWSIGPYTNFYYIVFDCSTPGQINCIAFRSLDMLDGDYDIRTGLPIHISLKRGALHLISNYYKTIRTETTEWETGRFTISQDRNNKWLIRGN